MTATRSLSTEIGSKPASETFGLVGSWFYRGQGSAKKPAPRPSPLRTLSSEEQQAILATMLDDGRYHSTEFWMSRWRSRSAGTSSATRSIRSRNFWRPPQITCGPGTSRNSWAP